MTIATAVVVVAVVAAVTAMMDIAGGGSVLNIWPENDLSVVQVYIQIFKMQLYRHLQLYES